MEIDKSVRRLRLGFVLPVVTLALLAAHCLSRFTNREAGTLESQVDALGSDAVAVEDQVRRPGSDHTSHRPAHDEDASNQPTTTRSNAAAAVDEGESVGVRLRIEDQRNHSLADVSIVSAGVVVATTDVHGRAAVSRDASWPVVCIHESHLPQSINPPSESATNEIVVHLDAGRQLRGRVVDQDGDPVAQAEVIASIGGVSGRMADRSVVQSVVLPRDVQFDWTSCLSKVVSTNADGQFEVGGLPAADLLLRVEKWGYVFQSDLGSVAAPAAQEEFLLHVMRVYASVSVSQWLNPCSDKHELHDVRVDEGPPLGLDHLGSNGWHALLAIEAILRNRLKSNLAREPIILLAAAKRGTGLKGQSFTRAIDAAAIWDERVACEQRWVPLDLFSAEDVTTIPIGINCPGHAALEVYSDFPVRIASGDAGPERHYLPIREESTGRSKLWLLPRRYVLSIAAGTLAAARRVDVELKAGDEKVIDFREFEKGISHLVVLVTDAAGQPTDAFRVSIRSTGAAMGIIVPLPGVHRVEMALDYGQYEIVVINATGQVQATRKVILGAEDREITLRVALR